jgi:hypothetical protein
MNITELLDINVHNNDIKYKKLLYDPTNFVNCRSYDMLTAGVIISFFCDVRCLNDLYSGISSHTSLPNFHSLLSSCLSSFR